MHEERLRQLNQLLPRAEANAEQCHDVADAADAVVEDIRTGIAEEKKERRHLRPLIFVPGGFGVAAALRAWHARPRGVVLAAAGGSASIATAGAIALAVIVTPGGQTPVKPRPSLTGDALPPTEPLPPAGHWPPPTGPPKGPPPKALPPTPPVTMPSPTPTPIVPPGPDVSAGTAVPKTHPLPKTKPPKVKPPKPHVPPVKPPKLPVPVITPPAAHSCVVDLLGVGLLCDRAVITGVLPIMWPNGDTTPTV